MAAVKTPYERYQEVTSLAAAQALYRRLGDQLSRAGVRGGQVLSRPMRHEAREVRRLLEQEYGAAVRTASLPGVTGPGQGQFERTTDTSTKRRHFTINKPRVIDPRSPILHIAFDPATGEPDSEHLDFVNALLRSWALADRHRSHRKESGRGRLSTKEWQRKRLDDQIGRLREILAALEAERSKLR